MDERRTAARFSFIATAEVMELPSGARVLARVSDLGLEGCYVDTLNPFSVGTRVQLRISKGKEVFETSGTVRNSQPSLGMGVAFSELTPDQGSVLAGWLTEYNVQLPLASEGQSSAARRQQHPALVVKLIELLVRKGILTEKDGAELLREPLL